MRARSLPSAHSPISTTSGPLGSTHAHEKLDAAVAAAYGWTDLTDILERGRSGEIYDFKSGAFAQVDCTLEGFAAILSDLEKQIDEQILERLLALNVERAAEESAPRNTARYANLADEARR